MAPQEAGNLDRNDIRPGAILINPNENNKQYRVDRIDGDKVHCVSLEDNTLKREFEIDTLLKKHWQLGKRAA